MWDSVWNFALPVYCTLSPRNRNKRRNTYYSWCNSVYVHKCLLRTIILLIRLCVKLADDASLLLKVHFISNFRYFLIIQQLLLFGLISPTVIPSDRKIIGCKMALNIKEYMNLFSLLLIKFLCLTETVSPNILSKQKIKDDEIMCVKIYKIYAGKT